jgi:hypothetical protein
MAEQIKGLGQSGFPSVAVLLPFFVMPSAAESVISKSNAEHK